MVFHSKDNSFVTRIVASDTHVGFDILHSLFLGNAAMGLAAKHANHGSTNIRVVINLLTRVTHLHQSLFASRVVREIVSDGASADIEAKRMGS